MQVRCPVDPGHIMVEIATELHQCPECGAGPLEFWAVGFVEVDGDLVGGLHVLWRPDLECYVLTNASWRIRAGRRVPGSLRTSLVGFASTETEVARTPLPLHGAVGDVLRLRELMFSSPLGEKTVRGGARAGRCSAAPAPAESEESSPLRRRRRVS